MPKSVCSSTLTITLYILENFNGYRRLNISREHVKYFHVFALSMKKLEKDGSVTTYNIHSSLNEHQPNLISCLTTTGVATKIKSISFPPWNAVCDRNLVLVFGTLVVIQSKLDGVSTWA